MDSPIVIVIVGIGLVVALCVWVWRTFGDSIAWSNAAEAIAALVQAFLGR